MGSSWRWTVRRGRASRARRGVWRPGWGCATSTPGAMFRAMTWWMLEHGVDVEDAAAVAAARRPAGAGLRHRPAGTRRSPSTAPTSPSRSAAQQVTGAVSAVSAVPEVRERLLRVQRDDHRRRGIVVEGRDIGTVVAPGRRRQGLPDRRPGGPGRPPRRRAVRRRRRRHPGRPGPPRQDRLGPGGLAAGDGRRRAPRRHHAVHPRRGRRPGRRAGREGAGLTGPIRLRTGRSGVLEAARLSPDPGWVRRTAADPRNNPVAPLVDARALHGRRSRGTIPGVSPAGVHDVRDRSRRKNA